MVKNYIVVVSVILYLMSLIPTVSPLRFDFLNIH
jgi:hypothetical protein